MLPRIFPFLLRETTLTFSYSIETGSPVETEIVRVVSLSTTEIIEITRFVKPIFRFGIPEWKQHVYFNVMTPFPHYPEF